MRMGLAEGGTEWDWLRLAEGGTRSIRGKGRHSSIQLGRARMRAAARHEAKGGTARYTARSSHLRPRAQSARAIRRRAPPSCARAARPRSRVAQAVAQAVGQAVGRGSGARQWGEAVTARQWRRQWCRQCGEARESEAARERGGPRESNVRQAPSAHQARVNGCGGSAHQAR
eukprot:689140-Prymnesium_polylepis.1